MKKIVTMMIVLILTLSSCSPEPIEMRTSNPQQGVNITGDKFMIVKDANDVHTPFTPSNIKIQFNPKTNILSIDDNNYTVIESTHYTITFKTWDNDIFVIEFNTGYVWQDNKTRTKFDMYEYGKKDKEYTVYTYNN